MKYFALLILLCGSFAMASEEETLGIVRILNNQQPKYDSKTGAVIPDSQNTILEIKNIQFNQKTPGLVALYTDGLSQYDGVVVIFKNATEDNSAPRKFGEFLYAENFQINLEKEDLSFATEGISSYIKVNASKIKVYSEKQKSFVSLNKDICPMVQEEVHWWTWGKPEMVRQDCL